MLELSSRPNFSDPLTVDCPLCTFKTSSSFGIRMHAIRNHLCAPHSSSSDGLSNVYGVSPPVECSRFSCQVYVCSMCGISTSSGVGIKSHVEKAHPTKLHDNCIILSESVELGQCVHNATPTSSDSECDWSDLPTNRIETAPNLPTSNFSSSITSSHQTTITPAGFPTTSSSETSDSGGGGEIVSLMNHKNSSPRHPHSRPPARGTVRDWHKLIARSEKKFICLLCRRYIYSGRTEVVFHSVTRHLLSNEINHDLSHHGRLTDEVKRKIGQNFADGMRIRSGVHYKDAKRVEAALFRSIELHIRYRPYSRDTATRLDHFGSPSSFSSSSMTIYYSCSGCGATFTDLTSAYTHVNDELRTYLPEFMRARSCPWSLSTRDEWVWVVPDLPIQPLSKKPIPSTTSTPVTHAIEPDLSDHEVKSSVSSLAEYSVPIIATDSFESSGNTGNVSPKTANLSTPIPLVTSIKFDESKN